MERKETVGGSKTIPRSSSSVVVDLITRVVSTSRHQEMIYTGDEDETLDSIRTNVVVRWSVKRGRTGSFLEAVLQLDRIGVSLRTHRLVSRKTPNEEMLSR